MAAIKPDVHCKHLNYTSEICNDEQDEFGQDPCKVAGDASAIDLTIDDNLLAAIRAQNATLLARGRTNWQFPKVCY